MTDHRTHVLQADAHRVLGELLAEGREHGLPPLRWMLATTGALTGEADGLAEREDPRAAVAAWTAHLGATVTETTHDDGHRVSLYAAFDWDGERQGALRAEIFRQDTDFDDELDQDLDDVADRHADIDAEVFELGDAGRGYHR
ncbi:MAG: hypothetical protein ACTH0H_05775 [Brachybacterium sp.]